MIDLTPLWYFVRHPRYTSPPSPLRIVLNLLLFPQSFVPASPSEVNHNWSVARCDYDEINVKSCFFFRRVYVGLKCNYCIPKKTARYRISGNTRRTREHRCDRDQILRTCQIKIGLDYGRFLARSLLFVCQNTVCTLHTPAVDNTGW